MKKQFVVFCLYVTRSNDYSSAVILLTDNVILAVDTAKDVKSLGFESKFVGVAEMVPGHIYKEEDFQLFKRTDDFPAIFISYVDEKGNRKIKWLDSKCSKKYELEKRVFLNDYGEIKEGTQVSFMVENQDDWAGDLEGKLIIEKGEFKIQTERSGILTIDKRLDVYGNTIQPIPVEVEA